MANPISVFPVFVKNEVYPNPATGPGRVVVGIDVTIEFLQITVAIAGSDNMSCSVTEENICRKRGDTWPFQITITDTDGVAIDITGDTFLLTVDPSPTPPDATNNLFQLAGVITDAPNGVVEFTLTPSQADQTPATYYYDVQQTEAVSGDIRTILQGEWEVRQDITK